MTGMDYCWPPPMKLTWKGIYAKQICIIVSDHARIDGFNSVIILLLYNDDSVSELLGQWVYQCIQDFGCSMQNTSVGEPQNVISYTACLQVSCGARHSAVLTITAEAFSTGCNKHGEVGQPKGLECIAKFTKLDIGKAAQLLDEPCNVTDLECGWWHTVLLTSPETNRRGHSAC